MSLELGKGQARSGGDQVGLLQQDPGERWLVWRHGSGHGSPGMGRRHALERIPQDW